MKLFIEFCLKHFHFVRKILTKTSIFAQPSHGQLELLKWKSHRSTGYASGFLSLARQIMIESVRAVEQIDVSSNISESMRYRTWKKARNEYLPSRFTGKRVSHNNQINNYDNNNKRRRQNACNFTQEFYGKGERDSAKEWKPHKESKRSERVRERMKSSIQWKM